MSLNPNENRLYWVLGHQVRPLSIPGDVGLVEALSMPGVPGPPPHCHDDTSEFFYVAEGALDVQVDGEWLRLEAGQSLTLAPGQVHTFINRTEKPVRWLTGWNPRGFEQFFTDFGVDAASDNAQVHSVSEEIVGRVIEKCAEYGMVMKG